MTTTGEVYSLGKHGRWTRDYDRRGLLTRETRTLDACLTTRDSVTPCNTFSFGRTDVTTYGYDQDGNRSKIGYPSTQLTVNYSFDYAGRPVSAAGIITSAAYLPFGPLTSLQFANGTRQTLEYDARYRMTANTLKAANLAPPNDTIANYALGYDGAGNVTNLQDVTDPTYHRSFGYDELNRLIRANSGSSLWQFGDYSWDAMGNILSATLSRAVTDDDGLARTNPKHFRPLNKPKRRSEVQLLSRSMEFSYSGTTALLSGVALNGLSHSVGADAAGNETSYVATRSYSPRNLLAQVQDQTDPEELSPHILRYGYDGRGVRVERTEMPSNGAGTAAHRFFFYTPELTLLAATRDDGINVWGGNAPTAFGKNIDYEIVWFAGRPVAQIAPGPSATSTRSAPVPAPTNPCASPVRSWP